jgi:hypothetical protein
MSPALQVHNLIPFAIVPHQLISQLIPYTYPFHIKGENFKVYISETKAHWTSGRDRFLFIFRLHSIDPIFIGIPDPSLMTSPCKYTYCLVHNLFVTSYSKEIYLMEVYILPSTYFICYFVFKKINLIEKYLLLH